MSMVEVNNLSFSYGNKLIFSDIGFQVQEGEIFCLVGPNGCGKSTLLHCLLKHQKYQKGSIKIAGQLLETYPPKKLAAFMAYVPQNHTRSFPYRVVDVVAMGQMRKHTSFTSKHDDEKKALAILESLDIGNLAYEDYTTLSGGELQMVLMARVICQDSAILVLDEPVAHLDVKRTQRILQLLLTLSKQSGKTIIMTTHDFNHPLQFEDAGARVRMALMEHGTISMAASPKVLLSSDYLNTLYQIDSRLITIDGDPPRHYLATWSK